ncbi:MAG: thymidine phosphorylase [Thermotogota bacterium]|nr:thymidine phosphorylase [Thermotogota bacterium]
MRMYDLIKKKRDNEENTREELAEIINGYVEGRIPDYQVSAWLMAVYFNHLSPGERYNLTEIMAESGDRIDLSKLDGIKVDKHSTGGVGDKVTLIIGPIAASLGLTFAKLSGRGLGHTGGTIDKLESIPGFRTSLSEKEFIENVKKHGIAVVGQTGKIAPADKKLYALRDVTATVDEISLIASSIMSKKLSIGSDLIILDVKTGNGAFMKDVSEAMVLAEAMIDIGKRHGRIMGAIVSDMNQPLGKAVGNSLEVKEAIETLKGDGPEDLSKICKTITSRMLQLAKNIEKAKADEMIDNVIDSGEAIKKFEEFIIAQGGTSEIRNKGSKVLPEAKNKESVCSNKSGYIKYIQTENIGLASMLLGAGRMRKEDSIDPSVGIVIEKKIGDYVEKGDSLAKIFFNDREKYMESVKLIKDSFEVSDEHVEKQRLIYKIY